VTLDRAFDLGDLMMLLCLDRAEPSDREDITAIEDILDRRRIASGSSRAARDDRPGRGLYVVPDAAP
jgi:hypothetical protein